MAIARSLLFLPLTLGLLMPSFLTSERANAQDGGRCFREIRGDYAMNDEKAVNLCKRATPYTLSCFRQTRTQYQVTDEEAIALCQEATAHTAGCFIETRAQYGVKDEAAIATCQYGGPSPYADQIIIIERRYPIYPWPYPTYPWPY